MNIKELAESYITNAENILKEPLKYPYHTVRKATIIRNLGFKNTVEELRKLAKQYSGCVSCIHSKPHPDAPVDISARTCELGLAQNTCRSYTKVSF